ncbi:MAG: hypothetical protein NDJ90_03725 [Oligoflexia bacterium]|nr:hypothetical protein [Oligoflexia bacterium]
MDFSRRRGGILGTYERSLRKFPATLHALSLLPLYLLAIVCAGLAVTPGVALFSRVFETSAGLAPILRYPLLCITGASGYFLYGACMVLLVPAVNRLLHVRPRAFRGPYHSLETVRWYIHNGLTYLVRYSFLEFITPTPFNTLFYRLMGMKVGKGVQINSSHISDPGLIELGDHVTIGGSAVVIAHYAVGGLLVIAPTRIGRGATIGLRATIMGGVEIGEKAKVLPNSAVLPNTKIPPGETWGGVPARKIDLRAESEPKLLNKVAG